MTDNFIIDGRKNQKQIKDEIRRLFLAYGRDHFNNIRLVIQNNHSFTSLFSTISIRGFFEKVTEIEIDKCSHFKKFNGLEKYVNLKKLTLTSLGSISPLSLTLPDNLTKLEFLKADCLSHFDSLGVYSNLKEIDLKIPIFKELTLPDDIRRLTNLEILNIDGKVENFPLETLTNLKKLTLIKKRIQNPDPDLNPDPHFSSRIKGLNNLEELKTNIILEPIVDGELTNVKLLKFFEYVSENFEKIPNLEEFIIQGVRNVNRAKVERIKDSIFRCNNLKKLRIFSSKFNIP